MSVAAVREYLEPWGKAGAVREFAVSSATVALAAEALGVEPARIAKTLAFAQGGGTILIVAAGDARIANARYKALFGIKAAMLPPDDTLAKTGHPVGGVCPFALADPAIRVFLDVSLKRFGTVFPACGSGNSAVELTPDELFACAKGADWVDVCTNWRTEEE